MLRLSPNAVLRAALLAAMCACGGTDSTGANATAVNGTMSGTLSDYGPWIGQTTVTASMANGTLKIIGQDVNFKKITLFLAGVDVNAAQTLPRTISITPENANLTGYAEFDEEYQTGIFQYNTFEAGHATIILTQAGPDRVVGTFNFEVHRWPAGSALPTGSASSRSLTGGVFDIHPTAGQ